MRSLRSRRVGCRRARCGPYAWSRTRCSTFERRPRAAALAERETRIALFVTMRRIGGRAARKNIAAPGTAISTERREAGFSSSALFLWRRVQRRRGTDQRLERLLVDRIAFMKVNGAPRVALEAGVEQLCRIVQRGALGE